MMENNPRPLVVDGDEAGTPDKKVTIPASLLKKIRQGARLDEGQFISGLRELAILIRKG